MVLREIKNGKRKSITPLKSPHAVSGRPTRGGQPCAAAL